MKCLKEVTLLMVLYAVTMFATFAELIGFVVVKKNPRRLKKFKINLFERNKEYSEVLCHYSLVAFKTCSETFCGPAISAK